MTLTKTIRLLIHWAPVILYSSLLFWLSSMPAAPGFQHYPDKVLHFIAYFAYAFLLSLAITRQSLFQMEWHKWVAVAILASAYAATDEFHQSFVPGRHASVYDWLADVAGILGMLTLRIFRVKWRGNAVRYEPI